jgi:hypothetical protein
MSETVGVRFGSGEQATSAIGHLPSVKTTTTNTHHKISTSNIKVGV